MEDEVIKTLQPAPIAHLGNYILGIVAFMAFPWLSILSIALGVLIIAATEVVRRSETFVITKNGIAREFKFLSAKKNFVEYEKIENLSVSQNIIERFLGIGTVSMDTAGGDEVEMSFHDIKDPVGVQKLIQQQMDSGEDKKTS